MHRIRTTRPLGLLFALATAAVAQTPTPEQYQDLLNQLKGKQDRINELATENARLRQEIADQGAKATTQAVRLMGSESRSYFLTQHYAAWQQFMDRYPAVRTMWTAYFVGSDVSDTAVTLLGDGQWPFGVADEAPVP